jgi:cell shape-determining protein MreD
VVNDIIKNSVRFIILILLQVLVFQNVRLGPFIILYPYVLFILLLPFELPKLFVLGISFVTGLTIDIFYDTPGLHAAATTLIGYFRFYFLKILSPRDGYESGLEPTYDSMGAYWFFTYSAILILIHHLFLFYLETFRFSEFFTTLLRVILSTLGTFVFVFIIQFLFAKNNKRA